MLGACALPEVDREMLATRTHVPVRLEGSRGPLSAERSAAILDRVKAKSPANDFLDRHLAVEEAIAGSPLSIGNKASLLQDGPATYKSMFDAMGAAREHIHLEMYIFEDDEVGRRFADKLLEKRAAGLQVNVMYDSVGSFATPKEFFKRLSDGGVDVLEFNPVNPAKASRGWQINQRNHRKLLLVDGRVAFVGGINISGVYSSGSFGGRGSSGRNDKGDDRPWRDTQLRLEGPVVAELQKSFVEIWRKQRGEGPVLKSAYPQLKPAGGEIVRAVSGWADDPVSAIYTTLLSAVASSQSSISITMAYFVPGPRFLEELKSAARRGVDVRLILPSFTDFWMVFHAGRAHYDELLEAGVKIHERKERLLHAKTAVVDGVWSTVGSSNLDWRSFTHNHELNAVVLGPEFGRQMGAIFEKDLASSQAITLEQWRDRPMADRARESAARVWAYWL